MNGASSIVLSDGTEVEVLWTETHNFLCKDEAGNYSFKEIASKARQCGEALIPTKIGHSLAKFEEEAIESGRECCGFELSEDFVRYVTAHAERIHAA